jgi:hypothetical protein
LSKFDLWEKLIALEGIGWLRNSVKRKVPSSSDSLVQKTGLSFEKKRPLDVVKFLMRSGLALPKVTLAKIKSFKRRKSDETLKLFNLTARRVNSSLGIKGKGVKGHQTLKSRVLVDLILARRMEFFNRNSID